MKGKKSKLHLAVAAAILAGVCGVMPSVQATPADTALPVGGISTSAIITKSGNTMTINGSANNLITWQSFSVGKDATVNFDTNNYLNYVRGNNLSEIYGKITGGGTIYIVNPNGIIIGDGATIDVGSLYLSTADLTGKLDSYANAVVGLSASGITFSGDVINKGTLKAAQTITVDGNDITFKNTDDVTAKNNASVKLTAKNSGEIHIGSATGTDPGYAYSGANYQYKLVSTTDELQAIKDNLTENFMLKNDITLDASSDTNFTPIGQSGSFTGHFDGLGYKISNLNISAGHNTGLFSSIGNGGVVENVGIASGNISGNSWVGSIAGANSGEIRNVYNKATVQGKGNGVGGIVGSNSSRGTVENAYNTGSVTESGDGVKQVGGIVGYNSGTVRNTYNAGEVTVTGKAGNDTDKGVGGIVGSISEWNGSGNRPADSTTGKVINSYNTGTINGNGVSASDNSVMPVGGIAGYTNSGATIENSYNVGSVSNSSTPDSNVGGIVGKDKDENNNGTVTGSYYKEVTSGTYTNTIGTSKTETELKQLNTFKTAWGDAIDSTGESRTAAWRIYENTTTPLLTAFMTRQDEESVTETVYNGSTDVGYTDAASTKTSTQAEGINWVNSVTAVTNKPLTLSDNVTKVYDGTTTATFTTDNLSGLVASDKSKVTITATANYDDKNVGTDKAVTYSKLALSGDKGKNYAIIDNGKLTTGEITQAPLTLTVNDYSKEYDGTTSAVGKGYSQSGTIFDGDSLSGTAVYAFTDKNVGVNKTLNLTGLTINDGNNGKNYNFVIVPSTNSAITQAPLTITAGEATKTYDGTPTATNATYEKTGLIQGETISGVTLTYDNKNVGTGNKTLTPSEAKILDADNNDSTANYKISYVANNTSTINKAPLTLTVVDFSKEYDGTTDAPGATYQLSIDKLYDGDSLSGTLVFDSAAVGTGKTLGFTEYTIGDGVNNDNYEVTYIPSTNSSITLNTPNAKVTLVEDQLEEAGSSMQQLQEATSVAATPETKAEELDTAATTQTTSGDSAGNNANESANAPTANDNTNTSMEWNGIGTVTMENNGINPPKSMSAEEVARQERGEE